METTRLGTRVLIMAGVAASIIIALCGTDRLAARPLGETEWRSYSDPLGFTMEIPRGWTVRRDPRSNRLEITGHQGERIVLSLLEGASRIESGSNLFSIARGLWADAQWQSPERDSGVWRLRGRTQSLRGTCSFLSIATGTGRRAYAVLAVAPVGRARMAEDRFAQSFASLRSPD